MYSFVNFCNQLSRLNDEAVNDLEAVLKNKIFKKGQLIQRQDKRCQNIYFIKSGLVKMYCYTDGKEFIMNFFKEGNMFTVLDSFPYQTPSKYNVIAIENTSLQYISYSDLERLTLKHHCIETFYRKLLLYATDNMMQRIRELLIQTHSEHYEKFFINNKGLVSRLSLGDLACYLGITQVSLSRIRAKK